ncbi:hypothetical protein BH23PAT1_BH23PAT1_2960 [soil metagenome]
MTKIIKNNPLRLSLFTIATLVLFYLFGINFFYFLILSFFPGFLFIKVKRDNFLVIVPFVFAFNYLLVITLASLISVIGIDLNVYSLLASSIAISLLALTYCLLRHRSFRLLDYQVQVKNKDVLPIYLFFFIVLLSRIIPIIDDPTPLVHDPQAHAFWAKKIINEESIKYFYSPGLHILTAVVSQTLDITLARSVNFITNFSSALLVIFWAIPLLIISRSRKIAYSAAFIASVIPVPTNLYYLAGKNSLVLGVTTTGFLFLLVAMYVNDQKRRKTTSVLLGLCVLGIGLIHYPSFVYAFAFSAIFVFISFFTTKARHIFSALLKTFKMCLPLFVAAFLVLLFAAATLKYDISNNEVRSDRAAASFHNSVIANNSVTDQSIAKLSQQTKTSIKLNNPVHASRIAVKDTVALSSKISQNLGVVFMYLILFSFLHAIWYLKNKKNNPLLAKLSLSLLLGIVTVMVILNIVNISSLHLIPDAGKFLVYVYAIVPMSILLAHLTQKVNLKILVVLLLLITCVSAYTTSNIFSSRSRRSWVNGYDLAAYTWLNENTRPGEGVVSLSVINSSRNRIIFPVDGGAWIPVFTDNVLATPFEETKFSAKNTHINHAYAQFLSSEERNQQKAIKHFTNKNIFYIYSDGNKAYSKLGIDSLISNNLAVTVYQNKEVTIVKFVNSTNK